jgi:hypothetical protein
MMVILRIRSAQTNNGCVEEMGCMAFMKRMRYQRARICGHLRNLRIVPLPSHAGWLGERQGTIRRFRRITALGLCGPLRLTDQPTVSAAA